MHSTLPDTTTAVVETVRFRLRPGVTPASFLASVASGRAVLARQPGFQARWLAEADGSWLDLVIWASPDAARQAAAMVMSDPDFAAFMAAIDTTTIAMEHRSIRMVQP